MPTVIIDAVTGRSRSYEWERQKSLCTQQFVGVACLSWMTKIKTFRPPRATRVVQPRASI